jgi:DHA2 family multidrug resistance protein
MEQLPSLVVYGFRRAFISLIAIICTFLSVLNISVANVAFYDIRVTLGASHDEVSWVMTAYSLAFMVIIPFSGWLSRRLGRRSYFAIAVMLFTVCSFFCGNANTIGELVILRFLQGFGGGGMLVLSHTIITESWPVEKRSTSQAFYISGMLAAGTLAAPFGGYIVDYYNWPFIFFANIPVGIIACVLILTCVRKGSYEKKEDWLGTLMLTVGGSSLYLVLARGQYEDWSSSLFIVVFSLVGLTGIILFVRRQLRSTSSPGETGYFKNINLQTGLILSFITTLGMAGSSIIIMASAPGWVTQQPAMPLWPTISVLVVMLMVATVLIVKGEVLKYVISTGMLFFTLFSCLLCRAVSEHVSTVYLFGLLMIRSLAVALLSVSVGTLALSKLEGKQIGQGVSLINLVQQLGAAVGFALFSSYNGQDTGSGRMEMANQVDRISPEVIGRLSEVLTANAADSTMVIDKTYAFMHANAFAAEPATVYSPYLFILFMGGAFLVCIPFVLYFVKNATGKDDDQ